MTLPKSRSRASYLDMQEPATQEGGAAALVEMLRHQIVVCQPTLRALVAFSPRDTATPVCKLWHVARNRQTTRLTCLDDITDAAVQALANSCPNLTTVYLTDCGNLTDAAVQALATSCPNLTTVDLCGCANITDAAVQALRESHKGIET